MGITTCGERGYLCEVCARLLGMPYDGWVINDAGRKECMCCHLHPWRMDLKPRDDVYQAMSDGLRELSAHICESSDGV